jgi:hypothetical protein
VLDDKELNQLLRQWQAPSAPPSLEEKFFPPAPRLSWPRWLLRGTIHVPVPLCIAAAAVVVLSVAAGVLNRQPAPRPVREVSLADFRPVKQLQPRIIRSGGEGN